jgi:hypothetical protein
MRDRLQDIGLLQGKRAVLREELKLAKAEYEKKYQEEEYYELMKIKEHESDMRDLEKKKGFLMEKIEVHSKSYTSYKNHIESMVSRFQKC